MAYDSPITAPGSDNPTEMYTTTMSGPSHAPGGPNKVIGTGAENPGTGPSEGSPLGAPWILLGFAAVYGFSVAIRRRKE